MPDSNQYKLLRTGNVRNGGRSARHRESAHVLAPNIDEFGHQSFAKEQLQALAQRMQDPAWPRGVLNIHGLEGLFTALLVLPLGLRPTVWLPLVWNETGWKVPVALQDADLYREFLESIVGFMRAIDVRLRETPPQSASISEALHARYQPKSLHPQRDWALGFGLAMNKSNYLSAMPDAVTHQALYSIAIQAKPPSTTRRQRGDVLPLTLQQAVLALAATRASRGPLGPLV